MASHFCRLGLFQNETYEVADRTLLKFVCVKIIQLTRIIKENEKGWGYKSTKIQMSMKYWFHCTAPQMRFWCQARFFFDSWTDPNIARSASASIFFFINRKPRRRLFFFFSKYRKAFGIFWAWASTCAHLAFHNDMAAACASSMEILPDVLFSTEFLKWWFVFSFSRINGNVCIASI